MEDKFIIELELGVEVVFNNKRGDHSITVETIDRRTGMDDKISLNHNEKIRLIQWLINSINIRP